MEGRSSVSTLSAAAWHPLKDDRSIRRRKRFQPVKIIDAILLIVIYGMLIGLADAVGVDAVGHPFRPRSASLSLEIRSEGW
jgi:hypothetical protein